jgi:hypothetical protein
MVGRSLLFCRSWSPTALGAACNTAVRPHCTSKSRTSLGETIRPRLKHSSYAELAPSFSRYLESRNSGVDLSRVWQNLKYPGRPTRFLFTRYNRSVPSLSHKIEITPRVCSQAHPRCVQSSCMQLATHSPAQFACSEIAGNWKQRVISDKR